MTAVDVSRRPVSHHPGVVAVDAVQEQAGAQGHPETQQQRIHDALCGNLSLPCTLWDHFSNPYGSRHSPAHTNCNNLLCGGMGANNSSRHSEVAMHSSLSASVVVVFELVALGEKQAVSELVDGNGCDDGGGGAVENHDASASAGVGWWGGGLEGKDSYLLHRYFRHRLHPCKQTRSLREH